MAIAYDKCSAVTILLPWATAKAEGNRL